MFLFSDINECETERPCSKGMDCINTAGGFDCRPSKTPKKYEKSKICYCLWLFLMCDVLTLERPYMKVIRKLHALQDSNNILINVLVSCKLVVSYSLNYGLSAISYRFSFISVFCLLLFCHNVFHLCKISTVTISSYNWSIYSIFT